MSVGFLLPFLVCCAVTGTVLAQPAMSSANAIAGASTSEEKKQQGKKRHACHCMFGGWGEKCKKICRELEEAKTAELELLNIEREMLDKERELTALRRKNKSLKRETENFRKVATSVGEQSEERGKTVPSDPGEGAQTQIMQELEHMQKSVQTISEKAVLEKFGSGPYFVKIQLEFSSDDSKDINSQGASVVVKLAPLSLMPHSIQHFLETVDQGLWDGCSFAVNAKHLVKAVPLGYAADADEDKHIPFQKAGLASPSFPEYHEEYPHRTYTLGFDGSSDETSFYINTADNREIHGPSKNDGSADPCFGVVVSGFNAIDRLKNAPTERGIWMKERVGIKKTEIFFS